ncbi:SGNH/GDSL hydrolase family protein [Chryseolinea sp. H1M3-3]|uniref:SGNH/GDSL hydrolase family protein n=1 Tax=Chryseolinea sp. H1M3-3 TaxID=3034144 RepID=UPI0023ECB72E|nr:SGNH/GDSL hydrolase family protein [Chryseolinea sp. H1M3-3]
MKLFFRIFILTFVLFAFSTKETTWVAIGDSITYLNEHPDETGHRITKGYMTRVSESLPDIHYINKGYNGWTAVRIAQEIETLELPDAGLYSIFLGTNDWWQGKPLGTIDDYKNQTGNNTFFGAYRTIVNKLRQLNKTARIILVTPMQRGDFVYITNMKNNAYGSYKEKNGQSLAEFADAVIAISEYEKLEAIDLYNKSGMTLKNMVKFKRLKDPQTGVYKNYPYPEYLNIPFNPESDEYPYPVESIDMTYDGLHPSDKGYKIIADMLLKILKQ